MLCAQWVAKDPRFLHADAQADLSLCWVHRSFCWFCHEAAQIRDVDTESCVSEFPVKQCFDSQISVEQIRWVFDDN